ncbi:hypothetical protein HAX54_016087 [Datura stramonium]|uniref:Uncharacterized protein n=1 Tax=Datura stramonium TaxID=4076 RepID=A0ABS8UK09_DATST|nr:hypothetical protein [Datura stramonium]
MNNIETNKQYVTPTQQKQAANIHCQGMDNALDISSSRQEETGNDNPMNIASSDQEEVTTEHTGDDLTTKEEGSLSTRVDDYAGTDEEHIDSDKKAEKLTQDFTNPNLKEVEQTFHEIIQRLNLSPRGGKTSKGKKGGHNSQSNMTRS